MFFTHLRTAAIFLIVFTVITGLLYPALVTGVAQLVFPDKANGSILMVKGDAVGSSLIGQPFGDPKYFWGRLSATGGFAYNAGASSGSNYGPLNEKLTDAARARVQALRSADPENPQAIPVDLVTASGSGLDPHISIASALFQAGRVARTRGMSPESVRVLIDQHTEGRFLGLLGEPRVNVLRLNMSLDNFTATEEHN
jgi:K+-transporting ATPase ATPase C chain